MRSDWLGLKPFFEAWKVLLEWEFLKTLNKGWQFFSRLVGLVVLLGLIVIIDDLLGETYFHILLPGLATVFLLHPFLACGSLLAARFELPFAWRSAPVSLIFFIYAGLVPRLIANLVGFVIFYTVLAGLGIAVPFFSVPLYWILFIALIPGAIGWGLIINAVEMLAETGGYVLPAGRRLIEFFGLVFILPVWLPLWLQPVHYLVPHSYLAQFARAIWLQRPLSAWYYSGGVLAGFVSLALGVTVFSLVLDKTVQNGGFDRYEW